MGDGNWSFVWHWQTIRNNNWTKKGLNIVLVARNTEALTEVAKYNSQDF